MGQPVTLKLREPIQAQWRVAGTVMEVTDEAVTLALRQKKATETIRIEFDQIALARRKVEFSK
jgi:ribosome maturation factor RimP